MIQGWGGHFQLSAHYMLCHWSGQVAIGIDLGYNIVVCDNCYKPLIRKIDEEIFVDRSNIIIDLDLLNDSLLSEQERTSA